VQNILLAIVLIVLTVLLHEAGHVLAALALRLKVRRCGVNAHGVYIVREPGEPAQNTVVILAGPAMNLLFAALFGGTMFGILNLVMAVMNLIPLANTDGRHLMNVLAKKAA
jgi:Zn-dependent protease